MLKKDYVIELSQTCFVYLNREVLLLYKIKPYLISQRLENQILELKSEIRASASRAKRDTGAAGSSKSSIAGKIRHKRSGRVCRPACDFQPVFRE